MLTQLMMPEHANAIGKVHGGWLMKMVDEAGGISAMRHAGRPCVTVAMDRMMFHSPVEVGDLVCCDAKVTYVGKSSVEVRVRVTAENPITGETTHTNSANVVYVAIDDGARPVGVPDLELETDEERERFELARQRQAERLAQKKRREQA